MAPIGKKGKPMACAASAAAVEPAVMPSRISKAEDLSPVLLLVSCDTNKWGATTISPGSEAPSGLVKIAYPFVLHIIYARLVPPFSNFFYAILSHYPIRALHL
ncbi:hypothetical protein D1007_59620 [Hordeum vulgare]|nr:hypothetical protein D1007_59620 [Hordeum vulgare]